MDLPDELLPNKDRQDRNASITCSERLEVKPNVNLSKTNDTPSLNTTTTTYSLVTQAATSTSRSSTGQSLLKHSSSIAQQHHGITPIQQSIRLAASTLLPQQSIAEMGSSSSLYQSHHIATGQQNLEKLSRPAAFDKMESLVREMQDPEHGVPVRQQKMFLTSIPYAFMGYDLIEWLMDRLLIEESEALNIANQLCLHGYFFPVNDTKMLTVKDDSSLYRFQTPYYWPWQHKPPDNVEYAIYLVKRSMRNKQRHALEDYELEALASLHKNLKGKWEIIKMQAEEQVRLAKERKKGDKIVGDSQERAYWRVYRPPPGQFTPLEPAPVPSRDRQGTKQNKKKLVEDLQREINYLRKSLTRTRIKMSQACESLVIYSETFAEYDFFLQPVLPSNPWVTEDITFWQLNNNFVDIPTEKRVKRWAISIEELVSDPTGLQEFTTFLEKEYSHENIRFWLAVNRLRRSAHSQVPRKVQEIYEEFLKPGAPCEINIDGKTMENVLKGLKHPSRFTFDAASEHIYTLLLKKDCYPRFIRSDHYKRLLETGIQPAHKKRFFNFGGVGGVKKKITTTPSSQGIMSGYDGNKTLCNMGAAIVMQTPNPGNLSRRRSSDRSLSGSAHELTAIDVSKDSTTKVPHSHSQSNLSELPFGEPQKSLSIRLDSVNDSDVTNSAVCPWDAADSETKIFSTATGKASIQLSICPWEQKTEISHNISRGNIQRLTSTSSDNSEINERTQRNLVMRHQHTVDSGDTVEKRLAPNLIEPRRASVSFTPRRKSEYSMGLSPSTSKVATTPSPTISTSHMAKYSALFKPLQVAQSATAVAAILGNVTNTGTNITKDQPSNSDTEMEELSKLSLSERSESSSSDLPVLPTTAPAPTPLLLTKITPPPPPPPPPFDEEDETLEISVESQPHATTEIKYIISQNSSPQDDVTTKDSSINVEKNLETEVDVKIDEVQIELIETNITDYKKLCEGEDPSILETNTVTHIIHIEEDKKNNAPALNVETLEETISTNAKLNVKEYDNEKLQEEVETTNTETASKQSKEEITVEFYGCTEDLSPTTDEFRETSQFGIDKEVCGYDLGINTTGYIPPAPTPAPVMAPLAEIDTDIVDDEGSEEMATCKESSPLPTFKLPLCSITKYQSEETRRRRKKKHIDSKKLSSMEENDVEQRKESEASTSSGIASKNSGAKSDETDIITVCPWEDENISTSDGTFVKTYATLGYL